MSKTYIFEGNTTNAAIEKGLKELNVSRNQVEIKTLDENKKSFFSILSPRVVKVEMTLKEEKKHEKPEEVIISEEEMDEQINVLKNFLDVFIEKLPTKEIKYEFEKENNSIKIIMNGENLNYLIGYRAENMYSLQTILNAISNRKFKRGARVILDINGHKKKREEDLNNLAIRLAKKVTKTRKSITLEPMNAYERKIIHTRLQGDSKVETHSIGKEPYRKLVISLKK
mgnify:CR=1 FL=1